VKIYSRYTKNIERKESKDTTIAESPHQITKEESKRRKKPKNCKTARKPLIR